MRNPIAVLIILIIMLLVDWYVFLAVKTITSAWQPKTKLVVQTSYVVISVIAIALLLLSSFLPADWQRKFYSSPVFSILVALLFSKLLAAVFLGIDDVRRLVVFISHKLQASNSNTLSVNETITRSVFLSWLGVVVGSSLFTTLIAGLFNKYNYQVKKIQIKFPNLPQSFNGFKILHISDIHSGSLKDVDAVQKGITTILKQNADVILFTGDMVNDRYEEVLPLKNIFSQLHAPYGVYSVLGNHDYGDYIVWPSVQHKQNNLQQLIKLQQEMGFKMLINEHVLLQKNNETIAVIGIENWGAKGRFPKYGKLNEAYKGCQQVPFKILMSHDPSHWEAQVIPEYSDIDLMLSGHTHGMQFGIENPYIKFSPVQFMYKQWAGLYKQAHQYLYVNRGFGFLGYQGRVGIMPEITVIELIR